jgi:CBS domain containing-hemolysin-like protein
MVCLYKNLSLESNMDIIRESHFTRFPLCGKDKDDILGIIHIRDVYERISEGQRPDLSTLTRPAVYVPESMEIKDVLRVLQKNRTELAVVVDEFGGTSGLITIEDIIEEIVGEIQDEFDVERPVFLVKGNETSIDARLLIEEVNDYFGIDIKDEENDTIGGWFFARLQEMPEIGSTLEYGDYLFTVQEMSGRRITRLLVKKQKKQAPSS